METGYFELLSRSAVEQLLRAGPEFQRFLDHFAVPGGPVRRFPNGAIEIDRGRVGEEEEADAFASCGSPGCGIEGAGTFNALGPFDPKRYYCIQYPEAHQKKLRSEITFEVNEGQVRPPAPGEFDLDHLEVTVAFRTRVGKAARQAFVETIAAWAATAAERGAFDDGPVSLVSPGVEFIGTRARFIIDASRSGQDTLNWLALVVFDFGEDVQVTTGIYFGSSPEFLDEFLGPARSEPVLVEFPKYRSAATREQPASAVPVGYVPPDARPDGRFKSRRFPVLVRPINEWDSFVATIYFGRALIEGEDEQLRTLIGSWLHLGSYGGFGGKGTHSAKEVRFDEAMDSAIIRADMGDTDPKIALRVLIRVLEGFESAGPPIDALVFGRPGLTEMEIS